MEKCQQPLGHLWPQLRRMHFGYSLCGVTETRQLYAQPTAEVIPVFPACFPSGNCPSSEPSCQQRAPRRQEISGRGDAGLSGPEVLATSQACLLPILCFRCFSALTLVLSHYHLVISSLFLYLACICVSRVHIECPCSQQLGYSIREHAMGFSITAFRCTSCCARGAGSCSESCCGFRIRLRQLMEPGAVSALGAAASELPRSLSQGEAQGRPLPRPWLCFVLCGECVSLSSCRAPRGTRFLGKGCFDLENKACLGFLPCWLGSSSG